MLQIDSLLRRLRRAPEPLKRRLRPMLVRAVTTLRAMPGGRLLIAAVRRLAPGLHGWLRRRYTYYVDSAVGRPMIAAPVELANLDVGATMVLGWLRRGGAERVN